MKQIATTTRLAGGASSALLVAALATGGTAALFAAMSLAPTDTGLVQTAQAANSLDAVFYGGKYKVGKVSFSVSKKNKLTCRYGKRLSRVTLNKVSKAVSNGRYVFGSGDLRYGYTARYKENGLYRVDPKTSKVKVLAKGRGGFSVEACTNRYVYYIWAPKTFIPNGTGKLYVYDLKKNRYKAIGNHGKGGAQVGGFIGKSLITCFSAGNGYTKGAMYSSRLDGSHAKRLGNAANVLGSRKGKIYYERVKTSPKVGIKVKLYTCDANGRHKKALSRWGNNIPKKYSSMYANRNHTRYNS
jgi:hypothetical protein